MLYTDKLKKYEGVVPSKIKNALNQLKEHLNIENEFEIYQLDKFRVAVALELDINLPSRGTSNNIDIKEKEPILLVFCLAKFPNLAPVVKSNRKDFPVEKLSHLYVVKDNSAPSLCLVRGDTDEWFANRQIQDLITVVKQWFAKAASGQLAEDGDEFDPVRGNFYCTFNFSIYCRL